MKEQELGLVDFWLGDGWLGHCHLKEDETGNPDETGQSAQCLVLTE